MEGEPFDALDGFLTNEVPWDAGLGEPDKLMTGIGRARDQPAERLSGATCVSNDLDLDALDWDALYSSAQGLLSPPSSPGSSLRLPGSPSAAGYSALWHPWQSASYPEALPPSQPLQGVQLQVSSSSDLRESTQLGGVMPSAGPSPCSASAFALAVAPGAISQPCSGAPLPTSAGPQELATSPTASFPCHQPSPWAGPSCASAPHRDGTAASGGGRCTIGVDVDGDPFSSGSGGGGCCGSTAASPVPEALQRAGAAAAAAASPLSSSVTPYAPAPTILMPAARAPSAAFLTPGAPSCGTVSIAMAATPPGAEDGAGGCYSSCAETSSAIAAAAAPMLSPGSGICGFAASPAHCRAAPAAPASSPNVTSDARPLELFSVMSQSSVCGSGATAADLSDGGSRALMTAHDQTSPQRPRAPPPLPSGSQPPPPPPLAAPLQSPTPSSMGGSCVSGPVPAPAPAPTVLPVPPPRPGSPPPAHARQLARAAAAIAAAAMLGQAPPDLEAMGLLPPGYYQAKPSRLQPQRGRHVEQHQQQSAQQQSTYRQPQQILQHPQHPQQQQQVVQLRDDAELHRTFDMRGSSAGGGTNGSNGGTNGSGGIGSTGGAVRGAPRGCDSGGCGCDCQRPSRSKSRSSLQRHHPYCRDGSATAGAAPAPACGKPCGPISSAAAPPLLQSCSAGAGDAAKYPSWLPLPTITAQRREQQYLSEEAGQPMELEVDGMLAMSLGDPEGVAAPPRASVTGSGDSNSAIETDGGGAPVAFGEGSERLDAAGEVDDNEADLRILREILCARSSSGGGGGGGGEGGPAAAIAAMTAPAATCMSSAGAQPSTTTTQTQHHGTQGGMYATSCPPAYGATDQLVHGSLVNGSAAAAAAAAAAANTGAQSSSMRPAEWSTGPLPLPPPGAVPAAAAPLQYGRGPASSTSVAGCLCPECRQSRWPAAAAFSTASPHGSTHPPLPPPPQISQPHTPPAPPYLGAAMPYPVGQAPRCMLPCCNPSPAAAAVASPMGAPWAAPRCTLPCCNPATRRGCDGARSAPGPTLMGAAVGPFAAACIQPPPSRQGPGALAQHPQHQPQPARRALCFPPVESAASGDASELRRCAWPAAAVAASSSSRAAPPLHPQPQPQLQLQPQPHPQPQLTCAQPRTRPAPVQVPATEPTFHLQHQQSSSPYEPCTKSGSSYSHGTASSTGCFDRSCSLPAPAANSYAAAAATMEPSGLLSPASSYTSVHRPAPEQQQQLQPQSQPPPPAQQQQPPEVLFAWPGRSTPPPRQPREWVRGPTPTAATAALPLASGTSLCSNPATASPHGWVQHRPPPPPPPQQQQPVGQALSVVQTGDVVVSQGYRGAVYLPLPPSGSPVAPHAGPATALHERSLEDQAQLYHHQQPCQQAQHIHCFLHQPHHHHDQQQQQQQQPLRQQLLKQSHHNYHSAGYCHYQQEQHQQQQQQQQVQEYSSWR